MLKKFMLFFLAFIMIVSVLPFTATTAFAANKKDENYFYPTMDTERIYSYIERVDREFSADNFSEGCWIDAWPTGQKSAYTFNYLGSYYEYKNSKEYISSVAKVASTVAAGYFDVEMNEIIIYRVDRGDGLDPLYGAVIAYDPENGACFYAVSSPDSAPVIYNFTQASGSIKIDVEYYTLHGLGTKEIYHTVTYRDDDGTYLSSQEVRSGNNAIPPSPPTKKGITAQWDHSGEFIEQDTEIFADYTGGEVFKPERPEEYYSSGQQVFLRDDYNQKTDRFLEDRGMSPTAVENMVVGHTFEDVPVQYGLWDKQKMHLKELGTYGELKREFDFRKEFIDLCEYLCDTYSFNMNEIMCYDSGMTINGRTRPCVVMGYDYEYSAVAIAYSLTDIQMHLYSTEDLRDQYIDITFDIDIMSGHATRKTHTVKYVTEDGSPIATDMVQDGKNVKIYPIPEVPEKDGYEGTWSHDGTGITKDTTIYPVYTRIGEEAEDSGPYTVNFYMPAWIVNLRNDEPATDENGNVYSDNDFVLIYSEQVKHGESVKNIPTIPWEASKPYEWHDWNNKCTGITENLDVLVVNKSGGKRIFSINNKTKDITCGSPDSAYGTIHNVTPIDFPEYESYLKDTEVGDWVQDSKEDLIRKYGLYSADVLAEAETYKFICTYNGSPNFPVYGYHYNFTASDEHLTENMAEKGTVLGYKGLFGDLTAEDLYKDDPEADSRFANLTEIVNEVAAEYKISADDVPIHGMSRDGSTPDDEYVVWTGFTYDHNGFFICEHGYHYYMDSRTSNDSYGKSIDSTCGGTVVNISEKALEYGGKESTPVDLCTVTFAFNGAVISEAEAPTGSKYELPEPMSIRGYKAEGWKYNGKLVENEIVLEGSSMTLEASYVEDEDANKGIKNTIFSYAYYFDYANAIKGLTTNKGTVNIGSLTGPQYYGLPEDDIKGDFVFELVGTYDDLEISSNDSVLRGFWQDVLDADQDYTPTAKNIPVYKLTRDGEFFSYGIIRAYDAEKGALIFDGDNNDYFISSSPYKRETDILFNVNYDGSALPYFSLDTTGDNVFFENAWSVDRVSSTSSFKASGMKDPVVDQYGTVGSVSGNWNIEELGKYSDVKNEIYTYYLDSTIKNAATLLGISADDVTVYDFRNGQTHVAYGTIIGQAGGDSGDTKLLFIGDTTKTGSYFCIAHESNIKEYYSMTKSGNIDYSAAIKKGFDEYIWVAFYAENEKVADMLVSPGTVLTELPEIPEKDGYTASWDYDNSPITEETRINAVYISESGEELDDPLNDKTFIPLGKDLEDGYIVAIRSENALLSYASSKGVAVEDNEDGEIVAPSKKVQWKASANEDGSWSFANTTTEELLAVITLENGEAAIGTVLGSEESDSETTNAGSCWILETAGGCNYLKTTVEDKTYYLALLEENEWTASSTGSTITFWKNPEESAVPDDPDDPDNPDNPDEPETGRGPLTKEELDENRPTVGPNEFMPAGSVNDGDMIILYLRSELKNNNRYSMINGINWNQNWVNKESGVTMEDINEGSIWIVEKDNDGCHNDSQDAYKLKNYYTGAYIVYTDYGIDITRPDKNEVIAKNWHVDLSYETTADGIKRTIASWYCHTENGGKLYLSVKSTGEITLSSGASNTFYMSRLGETRNFYAVQHLVDGELYNLQYVVEGKSITHPELPQKEGYSYCWATEGDTVNVNEDLVFESISSKDILTLYGIETGIKINGSTSDMTFCSHADYFHKDKTATLKLSEGSEEEFHNGYNSTTVNINNEAFVIGDFGYLRDYTNEEHKTQIEDKYKNKIIDNYGEEAFNNLKLHTVSKDGEIIAIGFFGGYFDCDANTEDKTSSARCCVYNFETSNGLIYGDSVYFVDAADVYYQSYSDSVCRWDPSCSYDDLFAVDFGSYNVVFKDLDGNIVYQEEVPYYEDLKIIPDVPRKEGYSGAWFASEDLYTGIYEDKVIYPIYYEVLAEHGTIATHKYGVERAIFDEDYSTSVKESTFKNYYSNGIMPNINYYYDYGYCTKAEYGNTITLGYIGTVSDLAIYTEDNNGFASVDKFKEKNYRGYFNYGHYKDYSGDYTQEESAEIPIFALVNEETGELLEIVGGYSAFAMSNEQDEAEYATLGIFDPQIRYEQFIYTTRPADDPVSIYDSKTKSYLRPLWHFKDGVENFSIDIFKDLKNISVKYIDENGESVYTEKVSLGSDIENVPAVPEKEGYTGSWDHDGKNIIGETTIRPNYTRITHTVTMNLDGGKSYNLEVVHGEDVGLPSTPPTKTGYIGSWDHDGKNITEDTVINAVYTQQEFTVTYIADGETIKTVTVLSGENASAPNVPEKVGYTGKWDHDGKNITADTSINAVYKEKTYEVKFVASGKTVDVQEVKHGQSATAPAVPAKEGYTGSWSGNYTNVTSNKTINAVYNAIKYTVRYYDEDYNLVSKQSVAYGQDAKEPDIPESKYSPGAGGRWDHDGKNITANTYIYPVYTYETHRVRYYVDGSLYNTQYVNNTQDAVPPAVPAKEGHNGSWDKDGKNITKDTSINAVYTPKTYRVIFMVDGEEIDDVGVKYGCAAEAPEIPEREGYSARWDKSINCVTSNMEVNAVYTVRQYQVKFYVNGKLLSYRYVDHGSNVDFPNVKEVEGCTVVWDYDGNNVKEDLTINGIYKLGGYTVDKVSGKTNEVIPKGVLYGLTYGNAIGTGTGEKLDLTGLNNGSEAYSLVFWREETGEEGSFTLSVPEQVTAPVIEMDYAAGTTKDVVGTDVYYGTSVNAMGTAGTNEKLSLIPETTYYFYRPAEGDKLRSDTTVVNVGIVPEAIEVTIDYVGGTTNEVIGTEIEYAFSDTELTVDEAKEFAFTEKGTGEKLSPEKRDEAYYMYFRVAATDEAFAGEITKVYVGPKGKCPNPGIDYKNVRTENTIGSSFIYGYSEDEMIYTGGGKKISLTPGKDLYFQRKGSNSNQTFESDVLHLVVPERPDIEGYYKFRNETIKGKGDGRLYGMTVGTKYKFLKVGASSYYTITLTNANNYVSMKSGDWQIRIEATDSSFASKYDYFTIEEGRNLSLTIKESKDGEVLSVIEGLSYQKAITQPEDLTKEGYIFDGWYWDNNGTEKEFDFSKGISDDRTVYAKWTQKEDEVPVNELSGDKWIADFGTVTEGSGTIPDAIDVTVTNNSESDVNILVLEPEYYSVSGADVIAAGASETYTIMPYAWISEAGNYDEEILICNADNFDSYYFVNALYTIEASEDFDITIKEDGGEVDEGGIVVDVGEEIELETEINENETPEINTTPVAYSRRYAAPAAYSRLYVAPVAKSVPAGYSVRWEDTDGNVISNDAKCKFGPFEQEGYYHYVLVVTGPKGNSVRVPITIYAGERENDHRITISPNSYRFGTDRNEVAEFTISNENGTQAVELANIGSFKEFKGEGESSFIFGGELFERKASMGKVILEPGERISFTVKPKEGLEPGVYAEMVGAGIGNGTNYALAAVGYTQGENIVIDTENDVDAFMGSNVMLRAKASGGNGKYTYEWTNVETGQVISRKSIALFGAAVTVKEGTIRLKLTVTDGNGDTAEENVFVNVLSNITADPDSINFGTAKLNTNVDGKTVVITNVGSKAETLNGVESEYFEVLGANGTVIESGESISLTVKPKKGMGVGVYSETITVLTQKGSSAEFKTYIEVVESIGGNGGTEGDKNNETADKPENNGGPQTGDSTPLTLYMITMIGAAAIIVFAFVYRKKRSR